MMNTVISVSSLSKKYVLGNTHQTSVRDVINSLFGLGSNNHKSNDDHEFWALKDINMNINEGEVVGIIGKNGAGKSTLLKILSRITAPTTGRIVINGRIASLLEVGTGFHPQLTGKENIFLNGSILGMSKQEIKTKYDAIVQFSEIEKFIDTPVKRYSSGMYVRLAFAVAAYLDPEILIIDEVLAVGDYSFQHKCFERIEAIRNNGKTILFVSHNIQAISRLCNRGIVFDRGQIVLDDTIKEATSYYMSTDKMEKQQAELYFEEPHDIPAWISKITLYGESDIPTNRIEVGEKWKVVINLTLKQDITDFVVAVGMTTLDGLAIRTCWSDISNGKVGSFEYTFSEEVMMYCPGEYQLTFGLSSRMKNIQVLSEIIMLTIQPTGALSRNINIPSLNKGITINPMKITVNTLT